MEKIEKAQKWSVDNDVNLLPVAILFHQGETDADSGISVVNNYKQNLSNLISWIRGVLGSPTIPFINGFIMKDYGTYYKNINDIFLELNEEDEYMKTVDMSNHYTSRGDNLHFDGEALEYMGQKMFEKYEELNL